MILCNAAYSHGPASYRLESWSTGIPQRRYLCAECAEFCRDELTARGIPNSSFPFKQGLSQVQQRVSKVEAGGRHLSGGECVGVGSEGRSPAVVGVVV